MLTSQITHIVVSSLSVPSRSIRLFTSDSADNTAKPKAIQKIRDTKAAEETIQNASESEAIELLRESASPICSRERVKPTNFPTSPRTPLSRSPTAAMICASGSGVLSMASTWSWRSLTRQQSPQRVQLFLRVWHVFDSRLCVLDGLVHLSRQLQCHQHDKVGKSLLTYLFEQISQAILLGRSFMRRRFKLGLRCDSTIRIQSSDRTVRLRQNPSSLLDQRLHGFDHLLLVKLFLRSSGSLVQVLRWSVETCNGIWGNLTMVIWFRIGLT